MRSFKHFHEESVDRGVTNELEEEEMLQALQANGTQGRQSEEKLSKSIDGEEETTEIIWSRMNKLDNAVIKLSYYCKQITF